jgi:hypothetical protein
MVMLLQDLPIIHKQIIEHVHLLHQLFSSVHVQESEILTIKYLYKNYLLTYYTHKRDMSLRAVYILELQICKRLPKTQRFWKNMLCPFPKHLLSPRSFQNLLCLLVPTLSLLRSTGSWSTHQYLYYPHETCTCEHTPSFILLEIDFNVQPHTFHAYWGPV